MWNAADLEADVGVVDAFVDLEREERDVQREIRDVERRIKRGIEGLILELRRLEAGSALLVVGGLGEDGHGRGERDDRDGQGQQDEGDEVSVREAGQYVPRRVGGVDRLLMKLDFGSWFGEEERGGGLMMGYDLSLATTVDHASKGLLE